MAAISWKTGQSDLWTDPAAWSTGTVPGSGDDVTIAVAPTFAGLPYTVTLQTSESVHSITQSQAASTIDLADSGLTVAATYALAGTLVLNQGMLQGGTVTSTGGSVVLAQAARSTQERSAAFRGTARWPSRCRSRTRTTTASPTSA